MNLPLLSVIIPTIDEAGQLPELLAQLAEQQNVALETIVADGGSIDATRMVAERFDAVFVSAAKGRGRQMNAAARRASGDYLLFLHADSRLGEELLLHDALQVLRRGIEQHGEDAVAGHFPLRFIRTTPANTLAYRYAEEKSAFNRPNTTNGDQGLLLTRDFFFRLGGFDESLPFLEDQRLAEKIRLEGKLLTLPGELHTSARRFEKEGFHRRYILMSMMMGLYSVGAHGFFQRAPGVYRLQQETGRLMLTPFFDIIRRMSREEWGLAGTVRTYYRLGRYIRQNSWQMFYFFDLLVRPLTGKWRYPLLALHDRIFAPLTNFRIFDALTGLLCFIWFMGVLAPFFRLCEYRSK